MKAILLLLLGFCLSSCINSLVPTIVTHTDVEGNKSVVVTGANLATRGNTETTGSGNIVGIPTFGASSKARVETQELQNQGSIKVADVIEIVGGDHSDDFNLWDAMKKLLFIDSSRDVMEKTVDAGKKIGLKAAD